MAHFVIVTGLVFGWFLDIVVGSRSQALCPLSRL